MILQDLTLFFLDTPYSFGFVGRFRASKPPFDAQYPKHSTIKNRLKKSG